MELDIGCEASIDDPAGYFARVREGGDVQWSDRHRAWVVLSHAGVAAGFRDHERLSSDRVDTFERAARGRSEAFHRAVEMLHAWLNFRDPPAHTRLREPLAAAFTPRAVSGLEARIRAIVAERLDALAAADGPVDLSAEFARPLPALVIAAVLGVEGEERERFQEWSDDIASLVFSLQPGQVDEQPVAHAAGEFIAFFERHIERERRAPGDSLLAYVVHSPIGELEPIELVGLCTLLLFGGHETTTTLLINTLGTLLERPDLREWLRDHPAADETAVDEFMRVGGPARTMPRKVRVDHEREGHLLRAGQNVFLCIAAANHDPAAFERPGGIDLLRDPNPQLGFGWGLHYCLGANLARLEARIALRMLLERFPRMESAGPVPPIRGGVMGFGRRPLPARLR
jgi:cytochrome P450